MHVTYIGSYEKDYPRNRTLTQGLRENGVEVRELHIDLWGGRPHKYKISLLQRVGLALRLILGYFRVFLQGLFCRTDCFVVGYPGHFDVFPVKVLCLLRRKPLVFDVFLSLWDSMVVDRGTVSTKSATSRLLHWVDRTSCRWADHLLLDTDSHIDYFVDTFGIPREKFTTVLVGCNSDIYKRRPEIEKRSEFTVAFHGKCIPLQGVEYIVRTAGLLQDEGVKFMMVTAGQLADTIREEASEAGIQNIEWHGMTPPEELAKLESSCHIALGVFGDTDKAQRVIPNKVYEAVGVGLPLITGDTPAVRRLFTHEKDCLLVPVADPEALADGIRRLRDDEGLCNRIRSEADQLQTDHFTITSLGRTLADVCRNLAR